MSKLSVILLAAGRSARFGEKEKKPFVNLDGRAVWLHSLEKFSIRDDITEILIVIAPEDQELVDRRYRANIAFLPNAKLVDGGAERVDSVQNALSHVSASAELVLIHDTARPCVTVELIDAVIAAARKTGAATLAVPLADTLKRSDDKRLVAETIPRERLWLIQTPQVFRRQLILDAYVRRDRSKTPTDDCQLIEALGQPVALVDSDPGNIKITSKADLRLADAVIKSRPPKKRDSFHPFADEKMW